MAPKSKTAAGGLKSYKTPGPNGGDIALNLSRADAISHASGKIFHVFVGGVMHQIETDRSLGELIAVGAEVDPE